MNPIRDFGKDVTVAGWKRVEWAKDQPQYRPLVTLCGNGSEGPVVSCWELSWREAFRLLLRRRVYMTLLCFHKPLTPSHVSTQMPVLHAGGDLTLVDS